MVLHFISGIQPITTQGSNITTEEPFTLVKSDFTNFFDDIQKVIRVGLN